MTTITTIAHPNIALIKYWGKRNASLHLPTKSSIALTLDALYTQTTIKASDKEHDSIMLNAAIAPERLAHPIIQFIQHVKQLYHINQSIAVTTSNNFPTAAGLASSASGFAALALALNDFFSLQTTPQELSILARYGSGSASRSICGGFSLWHKGLCDDGSDSYAEQLFPATHWPELRVIVVVVNQTCKTISSRDAMQQSVATSPSYADWIKKSEDRIDLMKQGIAEKNIHLIGELAEQDCLDMHQTMHDSKPPINFFVPATYTIIRTIRELRHKQSIPCYFTIDAGPNVKILCFEKNVTTILEQLYEINGVINCMTSKIGEQARRIIPEQPSSC